MDDDAPIRKAAVTVGEDLSSLSVDELGERIAALQAEIDRVDEARKKKQAELSAADAFFKPA